MKKGIKQTRAILYTRVSTSKQVEQGTSLENQEARLRQYADFHGFADAELITDEGLSGKTTDRPGFQLVMDAVKKKAVDAVIVYSLSRFARNTVATLEAVSLMNRNGITFHSLTEQVDTDSAVGRFFLAVLAALAQMEREQIGERTRSVLQHKKRNGERTGQVPFGKQETADGKLVDHEMEQITIHRVHDMRASGMKYAAIAETLQRQGITNKAGRVKWSKTQIWRI